MLRDFVLELVTAPGTGATVTLPGVAPTGRVTWANGFVTSQAYVFYVLDSSTQQEWGVGALTIGAPSTLTRPAVVLGNSAGTTARLNFTDTCRCYSGLPATPVIAALSAAIGRNLLINPRMGIRQRGLGPFTAVNAFTADHWQHQAVHSTGSFSDTLVAATDAMRAAVGDEDFAYVMQSVFTGGTGAGDFDLISQKIETAQILGNKTITVSFWAAAASGTPKIGLELAQSFGTGGTPSTTVTGIGMTAITLGTTWTRYRVTLAMPSLAGKTLGTNGDDFSVLNLWLSSGTTNSTTRAASIGVQSATVSLWGLQLEINPSLTPLERRAPVIELGMCQRFYQTGTVAAASYANSAGLAIGTSSQYSVSMRAAPTITPTFANTNVTAATVAGSAAHLYLSGTATLAGGYLLNCAYTAVAEL